MKEKKKKKLITKAGLIKGIRGSISIMLCLLIIPFLSIALSIVEYARYQEVLQSTKEIFEITGMSSLADYDEYINKRFGMLCTTQDGIAGEEGVSLLEENMNVLGKQTGIENGAVEPALALSNTEILEKQIADVSELTGTAAVLMEDFDLQELINKLQGVQQFTDIMNTVDDMAKLTDAITEAVNALKALKTAIETLRGSITNAVNSANALADKMSTFFTELETNGITLPQSATAEQIEAAISSFTPYIARFKEIYSDANGLIGQINTIKSNLDTVKSSAETFLQKVEAASDIADGTNTKNSADESGKVSEEAKSTLDSLLNSLVETAESVVEKLKTESIDLAKETLNNIVNTTIEQVGLSGVKDRYQEIVNGTYFNTPLTDTAKADIADFLKVVKEAIATHGTDGIVDFFKSKFVPNLNLDLRSLSEEFTSIIDNAEGILKEKLEDGAVSIVSALLNTVKKIFDLEVFYDGDLNAFVNMQGSAGGYQSFISALGSMMEASKKFTESLSGLDLFGMLDALATMLKSIKDLLTSIFEIIGEKIEAIAELGRDLVTLDGKEIYKKFIMSAYMRHNLPCRMNDGDYEGGMLTLTGKGLTDFPYNDIARPAAITGQSLGFDSESDDSKFQQLGSTMASLSNGQGTDTMFRGAELEYICAGSNSEIANQVAVFFDLYFLRLLLDLPSVFTDPEVGAVAAAANIASWVVYILYIVAEPFCDVVMLVNGYDLPLIRSGCWLTASGIAEFSTLLVNSAISVDSIKEGILSQSDSYAGDKKGTGGSGMSSNDSDSKLGKMSYESHVLVLLIIFVSKNDMVYRLSNLIELEAAEHYRQKGESFSMAKTYTAVKVSADVTFNPFFDFGKLNGGASTLFTKKLEQMISY